MIAGDEFYDDGVTSGLDIADVRAAADLRLAELKHSSSCAGCGSAEPVRIEGSVCSDCTTFPTCVGCDRWVGTGDGWLPGHVVIESEGEQVRICTTCWEGM